MVSRHAYSLGIFVFLVGSGFVLSQPAAEKKAPGGTLWTTGEATVRLVPDTVRVTFYVGTSRSTVQAAREGNDLHVKRVKDALLALKLKDLTIHVNGSNMVQLNERAADGTTKVSACQTRSHFIVVVRSSELDQLRSATTKVVDTAVEIGATGLNAIDEALPPVVAGAVPPPGGGNPAGGFGGKVKKGAFPGGAGVAANTATGPRVDWLKENTADARRKALGDAVQDALANARAMANGAAVKVLDTSTVDTVIHDTEDAPVPASGLDRLRAAPVRVANPESLFLTVRVRMTAMP